MQSLMYAFPSSHGMSNVNASSMHSQVPSFMAYSNQMTDGNESVYYKQMNGLQTLSTLSTLSTLPSQPSLTTMSSLTSLPGMSVLSPTSSLTSPLPSSHFSGSPVNIQSSSSSSNESHEMDSSEMWACYYGCGKSYKKSSGRSIRKHVVACFRAHWPGGEDLSEEQVSTLIAQEQDKGQLVTGLRRWRMRQSRRAANQLPEHERWFCPWECGQFYRSTSSRSIQRHALQCPKRPMEGDGSTNTAVATIDPSPDYSSNTNTNIHPIMVPPPANKMLSPLALKNEALVPLSSQKTFSQREASNINITQPSTIARPLPLAPALYPETSTASFGRLTSENMLGDVGKLGKIESSASPFYSSFINFPRVSSANENLIFADPFQRQFSQTFAPISWNRQGSQNTYSLNSSLLQAPFLPLGPLQSRSNSLLSVGNSDNNNNLLNPITIDSSLESIRSGRRSVAINLQQLLQSVLMTSDYSHPIFTRSLIPTDLLLRLLNADLANDRSDVLIDELISAISSSDRMGRLDSSMSLSTPSLNTSSSSSTAASISPMAKPLHNTNSNSLQHSDPSNKDSSSPIVHSNELNLPEQSSLSCLISATSLLNNTLNVLPNGMYQGHTILGNSLNHPTNTSGTNVFAEISNQQSEMQHDTTAAESYMALPNGSYARFPSNSVSYINNNHKVTLNSKLTANNINRPVNLDIKASKFTSKSLLWNCPNRCGVSLKLTSCKSIAKHRAACSSVFSSAPLPTRGISNDTQNGYQNDDHNHHYQNPSTNRGHKSTSDKKSNVRPSTMSLPSTTSFSTSKKVSAQRNKFRKLNSGNGIKCN